MSILDLSSVGIQFNSNLVVKKSESSGNGLFFNDNVTDMKQISDPLLTIPKSLIITKENIVEFAKSRPFLKNLLYKTNSGENQSSNPPTAPNPRQCITRFIIYLILSSRRGTPDEQFEFWLKSLPPGKDTNLPFTYPDEDLDELERSSIFDAIIAKKSNLKLNYEDYFSNLEFRKEIAEFVNSGKTEITRQIDAEVSYHDWQLIEEWILSRSLSIPREKNKKDEADEEDEEILDLALVPVIDLCNHDANANARYEVSSNGDVVLLLRDDATLPSDNQVTISYGSDKSAGEFLFTYGFIPAGYKNSKELSRFYSVDDTNIVKLLDLDNYSQNEDRIPYTFITKFLDRPVNRFTIAYPLAESPFPRWHDDLIYLLACEDSLLVHKDEESGYLELYYCNYEVDLNDVENFLIAVDRKKFLTEIVPRADEIAQRFLNAMLEQIKSGGEIGSSAGLSRTSQHELVGLEQKTIEETIKGLKYHATELERLNDEFKKIEV